MVDGEEVWRCPAPGCGRRTYGTGDPDDDQQLPPYTEADETGAVICHHGDGTVDLEATAELAAQDGPGPEDGPDEQEPGPAAAGWEPEVRDVRVKDLTHVLTGAWAWIYGDPAGWRFFTSAAYDPDRGDTAVTITYGDGEVVREDPWPEARMVNAGPDTIPTATRPGPAGLVKR
ncbi:hypothetical protein [Streptomyces mobaraensis]|uniref:Uncharacterized protein n=1 Tax=Streptomyces mobaraensis TaxID=35621 RepID=A0A5N5VZE3_STRMB|nr:hypothetical protein [Streptomyces mobaraensis]KAB7833541.1 hypothetical protein FRZ00_33380 [Streptomyces mobaraensis]